MTKDPTILTRINERLLAESGLSRVHQHIMEHESAIVTSYREGQGDNRDLKAFLLARGYGVTSVDGSFIENFDTARALEVKEQSLFVVNMPDDHEFYDVIIRLGKKYNQDSVILIPRGGQNAYLYGTNGSAFPGLDRTVVIGNWKGGQESEFMTRVSNRPFVFETYNQLSRLERQAVKAISRNIL